MSTSAAEAPRNRTLSAVFYGFAALVAVDIVVAGALNPDNGTVMFWVMQVLIAGQTLIWTLIAARRMARGRGRVTGFTLVGVITFFVVLGALMQLGQRNTSSAPAGWSVLQVLRLVSGAYVLALWAFLLHDRYVARRHG
jgi:hypothetical protein